MMATGPGLKVCSTKQNKTVFSEFVDALHCDNLLKNSQFHLSPPQLRMQIESNISPELVSAFDRWKDNHLSSDDESDKENKTADGAETGGMTKTASDALKAETKLQSFIDTLTKLDQKLMEDRNVHRCDAEEAARSLKQSGSVVGCMSCSQHSCPSK
jgi:hypothetical protein